jgi:hypothetical protein
MTRKKEEKTPTDKPAPKKVRRDLGKKLMPDCGPDGKPIYSKGAPTAKKEAFARAYVESRSWVDAYKASYTWENMSYTSIRVNANRLRQDPFVQQKIAELTRRLEDECVISLKKVTQFLLEDRQLAHKEGQAAAAVQASMHLAKIYGYYVDRRVVGTLEEFEQLTAPELRAYIAKQVETLKIAAPLMIEHDSGEFDGEDDGEPE